MNYAYGFMVCCKPGRADAARAQMQSMMERLRPPHPLGVSNAVNIYFQVASLAVGDTFQGGFFTDATQAQSSLLSNVLAGSFNYFVQGDGSGSNVYSGVNYYTFAEYLGLVPGITGVGISSQTVSSANFATGTVTNGQVVELMIVPEPDTIIFAGIGIGIGMAAWSIWRRRSNVEQRHIAGEDTAE
ncbi:MAG: hypothetical protein WCQ91_08725 [Planctomycetota bacterium]